MNITTPTIDDAARIRPLLSEYPFRAFQQRRQRIDPERLSAMLWESTQGALADSANDFAMAVDGDTTLGLIGLAPDEWHGGFFGLSMGKIQPFLVYRDPDAAGSALLDHALASALTRGYEHLSSRVDASDWGAIRLLESCGFSLVDGSQKLSLPTSRVPSSKDRPEGMSIGALRDGEGERLAVIASASHTTNHFFNDPSLDREAGKRLFEAWVARCCDGLARHLFVARDGDEPVGFASYIGASALERHLGIKVICLDFIVIDAARQGRGIGEWLLLETLNELAPQYDFVELRTSFNNYPALSLYHRLGFETIASDVILHRVATAGA